MAKYLIRATYVGEGVHGVLAEGGTSRKAAVKKAVQSVGGKLEALYFGIGGADAYVVADLPDAASAAALSLSIRATGRVNLEAELLLTPEEMDEAAKVGPKYRAPGT